MQLNLTGHHVEITDPLRSYVNEKMDKLERHFDHVTNVHVVLSVEKLRQKAEADVHVSGAELFAEATSEDMYAAIDARFDAMMNEGALEEARAFHALNLNPTLPASRAVGVAELMHVLDGEWTMERAIEKAKTHSRHLAKRQLTWFRRQIRTDLMVDEKYSERDYEKIFSFIRQFLLTPSA